jgi:hypothetical protein
MTVPEIVESKKKVEEIDMIVYVSRGEVSVGDRIIIEAKLSRTNQVVAVVQTATVFRVEPSTVHKYEEVDEVEFV